MNIAIIEIWDLALFTSLFMSRLPGDSRTKIGFITFDSTIHFYNLQEGLSQPQMLIVSDIEGETQLPVKATVYILLNVRIEYKYRAQLNFSNVNNITANQIHWLLFYRVCVCLCHRYLLTNTRQPFSKPQWMQRGRKISGCPKYQANDSHEF